MVKMVTGRNESWVPIESDSQRKASENIGACFPGDQNICLANKLNFALLI